MSGQLRAILWAQLRALRHYLAAGRGAAAVLSGITLAVWYLLWIALAAACLWFAARPGSEAILAPYLSRVFFGVFVYWQAGPVVLGVSGAALDLRKLLAFPVPRRQLFGLEVLLRVTTGVEVLLAAAGLAVGLTLNPAVAVKSAPLGLLLYLLFNLFLGAGLKYQIEGLLRRKHLREVLVFVMVMAVALPRLLLDASLPAPVRQAVSLLWLPWWPWSAASNLALGRTGGLAVAAAAGWMSLALIYGRWAFARGLRRDSAAAGPLRPDRAPARASRWDAVSRALSRLLPGSVAALAEKEIRTLARAPRFRLVFVMGFTFGVLIFLPMLLRNRAAGVEAPSYQLALVCGYALLLLGDMLFWNIFGYDRAASRFYFIQPLSLELVIAAKNLVAAFFVLLEITGVVAVWSLLRMPLDAGRLAEAYAATMVVCLYLMAAGNLTSVRYPRPVSPDKTSGAGSAATVRILLLLLLPLLSIPVLLAYLARYALASGLAFWTVLALAAAGGGVFLRASLASAAAHARARRELFVDALAAGQGPIQLE